MKYTAQFALNLVVNGCVAQIPGFIENLQQKTQKMFVNEFQDVKIGFTEIQNKITLWQAAAVAGMSDGGIECAMSKEEYE